MIVPSATRSWSSRRYRPRYLAAMLGRGARPHIPVDRHAPLTAFESIAAQIPVFRVTCVRAATPGPGGR
jgi:hypothetical protein